MRASINILDFVSLLALDLLAVRYAHRGITLLIGSAFASAQLWYQVRCKNGAKKALIARRSLKQ